MKDSPIKSAIINVSSATAARVKSDGKFTLNQYQVYQSTQNYQKVFMKSLHHEYSRYVDFMNDLPTTFDITKKNLEDLGL